MFDSYSPAAVAASAVLIDEMCAAARAENRAIAARLVKISELFEMRRREHGEEKDCAVDTWAAVGAEIAAALRTSLSMAGSHMYYALAMRDSLPKVAEVFVAGDIDFRTFQTIVYRTGLIEDEHKVAVADRRLAARAPRWGLMSQSRLNAAIDRVVRSVDVDAVRRKRERVQDRELTVWANDDGMAGVAGTLFAGDGTLLDQRLDALADSVCDADPRTRSQRRADALGALAAGHERLSCRCGSPGCPAGGRVPQKPNVTIHVVADEATVDGGADAPGYLVERGELIPAELVAELALEARLRPLVNPVDAPPEPGYVPSQRLADFVRCRDLTCRAPGCDRPAVECDIDHTVARSDGGATHASNLKCLCRMHHLLKTFWGWRDKQLPDGTVIWTLPGAQTYVTLAGSALLFPTLCTPTGDLATDDATKAGRRGDPRVMMPRRKTTRAQNRARYLAAERARNQKLREARRQAWEASHFGGAAPPPEQDDEPPPF